MPRRALSMLLLVIGLSGGIAELGLGQELAARGPRFLAAWAPAGRIVDASDAAPLRRRVSVDLTGVKADEALRAIVTAAHLEIAFNPALLPAERTVSLHVRDITVAAALTEVLLDTGVDVTVSRDGRLALAHRVAAAAPSVSDSGDVVGTVRDQATGAPIAGATVVVEGTDLTTTTSVDGKYRIAGLPSGRWTLRFRFIGYLPTGKPVTIAGGDEVTGDVTLARSIQRLEEVITTGTVVPTEVKALPTPVSVITSQDIEDGRQRDLHAIIRQAVPTAVGWDNPDVTPTETSFQLRGATTLGGPSGAVKVFVDGIEQADRSRGGVDPSSVERVEVVRGPQAATIYGSEAMGGVIQIFTKRGRSDGPVVVNASAGVGAIQTPYRNYGAGLRQSYTGSLSGGSASTTFSVGGSYGHTGAYVPEGQQSNYGVHGSTHTSVGRITLDLSARYFMSEGRNVLPPTLFSTGFSYYSRPLFWRVNELNQTVGARMTMIPKSWWRHEIILGFDRSSYSLGQTRARLTTPDDTLLFASEGSTAKTSIAYNTSVRVSLGSAISSTLTAGLDHYSKPNTYFESDGLPSTTGTLTPVVGYSIYGTRENTTNTGYFTQGQLGLEDRVFLTAGLRAEQNSNFGDSLGTPLSPRLGIAYLQSVGASLFKARASWGRGIRAPSSGLKGALYTSSGARLANSLLGPERQQGWDAGVDLAIGQHGSIGVTYFDQAADNLIQLVALTADTTQYQNVGRIHNTGVELESWVDVGALRLRAQFGYSRARVARLSPTYSGDLQVGDQVFNIPRYTAGASATLALTQSTRVTAGLTHVGGRQQYDDIGYFRCIGGTGPCRNEAFDYNRDYIITFPGFVKADVSITREFGPSLSGFLRMDNLSNNSAAEFSNISVATGRITTFGLRWTR